jgi:hypothetical protein
MDWYLFREKGLAASPVLFAIRGTFFYICARNKTLKNNPNGSIGASPLQNDSGNKKRHNHGKITLSEDF